MLEVRVQETDFSIDEEWSNCRSRMGGDAGAIVAFAGLVRDQFEDRSVQGLELEHYPGMTELSIQRAGEYAIKQWALLDVLIIHRVGLLNPSDQIVLVLVASEHRGAAFGACEFIMDFLKTDAPFWKKEQTPDGASWVDARESDSRARQRWQTANAE